MRSIARYAVVLATAAALSTALLDGCIIACHPSLASSTTDCHATQEAAQSGWQAIDVCSHDHEGSIDAAPQPRAESFLDIAMIVAAGPAPASAPPPAALFESHAFDPSISPSSSPAFGVPLRV